MENFLLILKAIFSGAITGFIVSIPLGPAGLESVKRTMSKGYREGILVAVGAVSADAFDLLLINFGIFDILNHNKRFEAFFWIICGLLLTFIGYVSMKSAKKGITDKKPEFIRSDWARSMPLLTGFLITFSNPMTHSLWLTLSGTVIRVWYYAGELPYYTFIFSIIIGMIMWFVLLNYLVLKGKQIVPSTSSKKISIYMALGIMGVGIAFIVFGLVKSILLIKT